VHQRGKPPPSGRKQGLVGRGSLFGKGSLWESLVVLLGASLGGQSQGDIIAVGLAKDNFSLVNDIHIILKLGNVEALLLLDVLADNLGDGDVLGHAVLDWLWGSNINLDVQWDSDKGDLERLGLVFLMTVLVLTSSVVVTITRGLAGGDLHGLSFGLICDLGGGGNQGLWLGDIVVGADLPWLDLGGLLADSSDLLVAVFIVYDNLDGQSLWSSLGGESRDAHLSVDAGVGVPAVDLGLVAIPGVWGSSSQGWQEE